MKRQDFELSVLSLELKKNPMALQLLVIVPLSDTERCLDTVVDEWMGELNQIGLDYELLLLDGSSQNRVEAFIGREGIRSQRYGNLGYGQMCLEGYRRACWSGATWVLQIDAGGQGDPAFFRAMWDQRHGCDVVYGHRAGRCDGSMHMLTCPLLRGLLRVTTGVDCPDAAAPYRLMSTAKLLPLVETVPSGFNLANIALAVQIKRAGWREAIVPITFRRRPSPGPAIPRMRSVGQALELCGQLLLLPRPVLPKVD